jgi:GAF domain-containing protein
MCAGSSGPEPLPPDTEERLAAFTELVATAIANSEARDRLHRIVAEQAALRQVALLVAEGASPSELFAAVAEGIATVFGLGTVTLDRYDAGFTTTLAQCRAPMFPVGTRWPLDGESLSATVLETGRPARLDDYTGLEGTIAKAIREVGTRSTVGVPIVVEGRVWGIVAVGTSGPEPLPADTEERLAGFTELLGTAIANAEARENLRRLADEQAALRRVATLVAEGAEAEALFSTVAEEIAHVLDVPTVTIGRYEGDASIVIASLNAPSEAPSRPRTARTGSARRSACPSSWRAGCGA